MDMDIPRPQRMSQEQLEAVADIISRWEPEGKAEDHQAFMVFIIYLFEHAMAVENELTVAKKQPRGM